ncbi:cell death activator CIDE-3 [Osmerus mordax]|uniref:cell death activator CIDE-3 n=1 Tax=Osmerus mordax TaxID=8014 RepID=UPI0035102FF4
MTLNYAMKSFSLLSPTSLSKRVTDGVSASASMTQQLLTVRTAPSKPFRVTIFDRSVKKGIMAESLQDLINKARDSLQVSCDGVLVLEEDGTGVDTEDFFLTLPNNAALMLLNKGQKWTPSQCSSRVQHRKDVARVTFDLYKNNPKDFIGCMNVKATLYGVYTVSYDVRCYAAKTMFKEMLRWTLFSMQTTGHLLLGSSFYIEQMLDEEEQAEKGLALPKSSRIKKLQCALMGKTAQ